jgi:hypothetical protein
VVRITGVPSDCDVATRRSPSISRVVLPAVAGTHRADTYSRIPAFELK